jgi:hypothetical protein
VKLRDVLGYFRLLPKTLNFLINDIYKNHLILPQAHVVVDFLAYKLAYVEGGFMIPNFIIFL